MRAVLCTSWGPPESLVVDDRPTPEPGPGEVRVRVRACGVNFPDTLIIQGKYQFKPGLPFTPGSDVAGVVEAVGEGVTAHSVGDEVIAMPKWGGFAECITVAADQVFPKPPSMDFATAASFLMVYSTSYHALRDRARIKEGETLLVLGAAGGVGLTAVELGALMGARVIAAASTDEKLELCKTYGAHDTINYSDLSPTELKDRLKALTDGRGVDVVYDPVGGSFSEAALRAMAWKGRFLVVGFAAGDIPEIPLNLVLLKGCQVVGVFWGRFALQEEPQRNMMNIMQLVQWQGEGKLNPHIDGTYTLDEVPKALRAMMNREIKGKIVITPSPA